MESLLARRARNARSSVIRDLLRLVEQPGVLSLAGGLPAADCFPVERLRVAADRALAAVGVLGTQALQYGPTEGDGELRDLVAARAGVESSSVLITAGSQQALDLLARALIDPGDVVVVERPAYLGALQALRTCEPELVGIESDADGMRTDRLADRLEGGLRPKVVYVVPNFQNPTGAVMAVERRRQLAELADRFGFVVIEDDPYGELRFEGEALPPVASFGERVVRLGTVSKVLAPGLRVGWAIAPAALVGPLVRLKQAADLHTSSLSQRVALDAWGDDAFMAEHLTLLRRVYADRAAALLAALPPALKADAPRGGLFLWARAVGLDDSTALLPVAVEQGVAFVPGSAFDLDDRPGPWLRLSFSVLDPEQLGLAADRLGAALGAVLPERAQRSASSARSALAGNASSR